MPSNRFSVPFALVLGLAVTSGCATHTAPVVLAPPPAALVAAAMPMPAGAYPGIPIPARFADGSYETPNRGLSPAAAVWHLRAGLNVAALACRGADDAVLVARYNAVLARQRTVLRDAEAQLAGEYRARGGAAWRDRYDGSMTVLYNFFSQGFARDAFCSAASKILAETETIAPDTFPAFAAARLPVLDQVFTDFYVRYDSWRTRLVPVAPSVQPVASVQPSFSVAAVRPTPERRAAKRARRGPWIELDQVASLPDPEGHEVHATMSMRELASAQPTR